MRSNDSEFKRVVPFLCKTQNNPIPQHKQGTNIAEAPIRQRVDILLFHGIVDNAQQRRIAGCVLANFPDHNSAELSFPRELYFGANRRWTVEIQLVNFV